MNFPYSTKIKRKSVLIASVWLVLTLVYVIFSSNFSFFYVGYAFIAVLYLGSYFFYKTRNYIEITEDQILVNTFRKKVITIKNIVSITQFTGDYTIKTTDKVQSVTIFKSVLNPNDYDQLEGILKDLQIKIATQNKETLVSTT